MRSLVALAYNLSNYQITGGPSWVNSLGYNIIAKAVAGFKERAPTAAAPAVDEEAEQLRLRLQSLLTERFKLTFHRETKQRPIYSLQVAKNGPKLRNAGGGGAWGNVRVLRGSMIGGGVPMSRLAHELSNLLDRPVLDQTGLTGRYEFNLEWPPADRMGIIAAIQQQLGLKLVVQKGPFEILVVDHAEKAATTE
jgi:uncharacterized protein (TIGR03435 family)